MLRCLLAFVCFLSLAVPFSRGQSSGPALSDAFGTYLGVLFKAVPESRLGPSARPAGVLITHVLPDSPAAAAGLQRDDILLRYGDRAIHNPEQLARLIHNDRPERRVKLTFQRAGREMTAEATLARGPVLQLAPAAANAVREPEVARAEAKQGSPPAVSVSAAPLADGNLKVTIEYYQDRTGRIQKVTCSGTPAEIDREVQKLPARVQELTRVALQRIHLELNPSTRSRSTPSKP
jgi:hypothetical protein